MPRIKKLTIKTNNTTLLWFMQHNPELVSMMYNIYYHMKQKNFDYPFVITGDPGLGKSMFSLHFYELWYRVILMREIDNKDMKNINSERILWLRNFKTLSAYEINLNDEGADGLSSDEAMTRFGRDIKKLYKINRKKKFLTPIIVLDYFELPPFFRKRVRGCFWINKQGEYKYYSREGLRYLGLKNQIGNPIKSMQLAYPFITGNYPDYFGILREDYDEKSQYSADRILDEMINQNETETKINSKNLVNVATPRVKDFLSQGFNKEEIVSKLRIEKSVVTRIMNNIRAEEIEEEFRNNIVQ